jgi:hypothetical protein
VSNPNQALKTPHKTHFKELKTQKKVEAKEDIWQTTKIITVATAVWIAARSAVVVLWM